jgi:hypothetical protein
MSRLLHLTLRAYPAEGRVELLAAMHETYGDETPLRESLRVLTNGLKLKTRESNRPGDLVRVAYFVSCCMFAIEFPVSQLMNHWELQKIDFLDFAIMMGAACWALAMLSQRVVLLRIVGAVMTGLTFWDWTTEPFPSYPVHARWFVPVAVAAYVALTILPVSSRQLAVLLISVTAMRLLSTTNERWNLPLSDWPRKLGIGDLVTNLVFRDVLLWVVPFLLLKRSRTSSTQCLSFPAASRWPILWATAFGALEAGAFSGGGPRAHFVMYVFAFFVIGFFLMAGVFAPWRPLWWASLSWFFVINGFSWFVNLGPIIPGLSAILFFIGGASLFTITRRTNRLLLA